MTETKGAKYKEFWIDSNEHSSLYRPSGRHTAWQKEQSTYNGNRAFIHVVEIAALVAAQARLEECEARYRANDIRWMNLATTMCNERDHLRAERERVSGGKLNCEDCGSILAKW